MKATYEKVRGIRGIGKIAELFAQPFSQDYVKKVETELNTISQTMCAAKWLQSTIHLEIGETHSCHHPKRHVVPLAELATNPSALHNTEYKKRERKKMLAGERPEECSYCWSVEDLPNKPLSDRHYKSSSDWARPHLKGLGQLSGEENVAATYIELSFSSRCQLRCAYCSPTVSSSIRSEIAKFGPYPTSQPFGIEEANYNQVDAYTTAFWKWWPEAKKELNVFRITGGEPLLEEDTFKVMESLLNEPQPKLRFGVNSNLMISPKSFERFVSLASQILKKRAVKEFRIYPSIDTWGEQAEWIRDGLKIETFSKRIEILLENLPNAQMTLMVTFNALSPFRFVELLDYVLWCRERYPDAEILVDTSLLHHPDFLSLDALPKTYHYLLEGIRTHMQANSKLKRGPSGFTAHEISRFERIVSWWEEKPTAHERWSDLEVFIAEYDRRKGLSFKLIFPEFWKEQRS